MKFPTPEGVRVLRGEQHEARECYNQSIRTAEKKIEKVQTCEQRFVSSGPIDENLDPRVIDEEKKNGPVEELAELPVDKCDKSKTLKI
ncbi:hypothetical protein TorRG33x02_195690, partial [Trema orientale]